MDPHAGEDAESVKFCAIISTQALMRRYLYQQEKDWVLLLDATYQTNMEGAPIIFFGANTFDTGNKFLGIGAVICRYCNVFYCTVLYCSVLNCIALYCTVLYLFSDCRWYIVYSMEYAQFDTFSMSFVCKIQLMKLIIEYAQFSIFSLVTAVTIQVMKFCQFRIFCHIYVSNLYFMNLA